ncbi:MAG TPA: TetR/AcrR family transcriptional regulator [Vicinamibacteria bacterium]|nr:TetR/AcrR family transcriptional regulator [Vicinamibacteria bacterium]
MPKALKKNNIRDSEATREALMAAGSELFATHGFDGVSVEEIAAKAGVNKAMISYHFRGKKGLHTAILVSTFDEVAATVRALAESGQRAPAQLAAFLDTVARLATTRRPAFPALFMRQVLSAESIDRDVFPHVGVLIGTVMAVIARGIQEGSLHPVDPFSAYWSLLTPLTLFLATEPTRTRVREERLVPFEFPSIATFTRHLKDTVLRGMCTDYEKEKV